MILRAVVPADILKRWDKLATIQLCNVAWADIHRQEMRIAELQERTAAAEAALSRWEDWAETEREETLARIKEQGMQAGITMQGHIIGVLPP